MSLELLQHLAPVPHVDAAPDKHYPVRVLEASLHNETCCAFSDNTSGLPPTDPVILALNAASETRAAALSRAIRILRDKI